jgi:hypothetical protein
MTMKPKTKRTLQRTALLLALGAIPFSLWYLYVDGTSDPRLASPPSDVVFSDGFEEPEGGGGDPCDDPLVMPEGLVGVHRTWAQCFTPPDGSPVPEYPNSLGFPVPLGADKGTYKACEFTAQVNQVTNLFVEPAQANPGQGYRMPRPAQSMFLGVSICPGDFRTTLPGCWMVVNTGTLVTETVEANSPLACPLVAGQKYWLTVAPVDPRDGLTLGEHTCQSVPNSENGCDQQARQTSN